MVENEDEWWVLDEGGDGGGGVGEWIWSCCWEGLVGKAMDLTIGMAK